VSRADYVVENAGDACEVAQQVEQLWSQLETGTDTSPWGRDGLRNPTPAAP
jgi:hypothetical protein